MSTVFEVDAPACLMPASMTLHTSCHVNIPRVLKRRHVQNAEAIASVARLRRVREAQALNSFKAPHDVPSTGAAGSGEAIQHDAYDVCTRHTVDTDTADCTTHTRHESHVHISSNTEGGDEIVVQQPLASRGACSLKRNAKHFNFRLDGSRFKSQCVDCLDEVVAGIS